MGMMHEGQELNLLEVQSSEQNILKFSSFNGESHLISMTTCHQTRDGFKLCLYYMDIC